MTKLEKKILKGMKNLKKYLKKNEKIVLNWHSDYVDIFLNNGKYELEGIRVYKDGCYHVFNHCYYFIAKKLDFLGFQEIELEN